MSRSKTTLILLPLLALIIILLGIFVWRQFFPKYNTGDPTREMLSAVTGVRDVLRVTSVEGERAVPVTYHGKDGTNAFGVGSYRYRISYDVDSLKSYRSGDTLLLIRLPKEEIRIYEDEMRGFRVLDVWGSGFLKNLFGTSLSSDQENAMKQMATNRLLQIIETDGTVSKAREEAITTVSEMFSLSAIGGKVVVLPPLDEETGKDPMMLKPGIRPLPVPKEYVTRP